jgi:hypothetical protein
MLCRILMMLIDVLLGVAFCITLNAVLKSVVMLIVVVLTVAMPSVILLRVVTLTD